MIAPAFSIGLWGFPEQFRSIQISIFDGFHLLTWLAWLIEADLVEVASTGLLPDVLVDNLGTMVGREDWIDDDSDDNEDGEDSDKVVRHLRPQDQVPWDRWRTWTACCRIGGWRGRPHHLVVIDVDVQMFSFYRHESLSENSFTQRVSLPINCAYWEAP